MKKKMIFAGVVVLLSAAAVTGYITNQRAPASDLFSANVEALTSGEAIPTGAIWSTEDGSKNCCGPGNVRDCGTSGIPPCK